MCEENICKRKYKRRGGISIERVIDIALNEAGYMEKASEKNLYSKTANAGRNNYTKYAHEMSAYHKGIYANGYAWCDTFMDWCMVKAYGDKALELIHGWSAYTPTSAQYYKNHNEWHTKARAGDVIFFKDGHGTICHTGLVYEVDSEYVYTVEGNTSCVTGLAANGGMVAKKRYPADYNRIAGYGRPNYALVQKKEEKKMYNKISDCPAWAQPYVKKAVDKGYIRGTGDGNLNLDDMKIWCLTVMLRIAGIMS